jgi:hypothetical protein
MSGVGGVVRLPSRRLVVIVTVALAPAVVISLAWLLSLGVLPWALQAIGTTVVVVVWVIWALAPYTALWSLALLVAQYLPGPALRVASLVLLIAGALLLDLSTAFLAWIAHQVAAKAGDKGLAYTFFVTPLVELLELVVSGVLSGLVLAITALIAGVVRGRARILPTG